jgi:hypothetical protein
MPRVCEIISGPAVGFAQQLHAVPRAPHQGVGFLNSAGGLRDGALMLGCRKTGHVQDLRTGTARRVEELSLARQANLAASRLGGLSLGFIEQPRIGGVEGHSAPVEGNEHSPVVVDELTSSSTSLHFATTA